MIDWTKATLIDREPDRPTRWIKESVHIRKEGRQAELEKNSVFERKSFFRFLGFYVLMYEDQTKL